MEPAPETNAEDELIVAERVEPVVRRAGPQRYNLRYFVDTPWVMLLVLFGMTGVLGLPALWASRGFSGWMKLLLSVVVTAYTALLVWITWLSIHAAYESIRGAL